MYINFFGYWYPAEKVLMLAIIFWVMVVFVVNFVPQIERLFYSPPPPPQTPEDLDQDAAWYRAQKRRLEAIAEYELQQAELDDTRRFLNTRHNAK